jgi:hypothetical protein
MAVFDRTSGEDDDKKLKLNFLFFLGHYNVCVNLTPLLVKILLLTSLSLSILNYLTPQQCISLEFYYRDYRMVCFTQQKLTLIYAEVGPGAVTCA